MRAGVARETRSSVPTVVMVMFVVMEMMMMMATIYCLRSANTMLTSFLIIYLFWLHWVLVAACRIFVVACGIFFLVVAC